MLTVDIEEQENVKLENEIFFLIFLVGVHPPGPPGTRNFIELVPGHLR